MKKLLLQTGIGFLFALTGLLFHTGDFQVQAAEETTLEPVKYINRYYDEEKGEVVSESEVCEDYTVLTADITTLKNGWYVVKDNVEMGSTVEIHGDVRVIIEMENSGQFTIAISMLPEPTNLQYMQEQSRPAS